MHSFVLVSIGGQPLQRLLMKHRKSRYLAAECPSAVSKKRDITITQRKTTHGFQSDYATRRAINPALIILPRKIRYA